MRELILGGVRSGKSRYAERRAHDLAEDVTFIATAEPHGDDGMAQRIRDHRARRPEHWRTVEEPRALAQAILEHDSAQRVLLVDCLSLWLTNLLLADEASASSPPASASLEAERERLLQAVESAHGHLLLIGNETGLGVTPTTALARRFCDEAGGLHQALATRCEQVTWLLAGLPQPVKSAPSA